MAAAALKPRIQSIDALRGFVMIGMALDHTREFFHAGAMQFQPEDLTRTTAALFFTRWITHICAPVFMFTAGLGAFFWRSRGRTTAELSRFLWTRGLWLVLLELTALRFALNFSFFSGPVLLTILWALGWSMVALGFLVRLPIRVLAAVSVAVIVLHNLADPIPAAHFGRAAWIWNILHQPGFLSAAGVPILVAYPLVPWIFVMAAGFCFGPIVTRRREVFRIGLAMTAAFLLVRTGNLYGDPLRWSVQRTPVLTALSFLRCIKYPPSLDFLLMTLGPALLLLAAFGGIAFRKTNPLIVFGRVPLFYFLVHLFVIHVLTIPFALLRYGHAGFLLNPLPSMGGPANLYPPRYGYALPVVYAVWIGVVAIMYPLCLRFASLKERSRAWWLSYL